MQTLGFTEIIFIFVKTNTEIMTKINLNSETEKIKKFFRYNFNNISMTPEVIAMINADIIFLEPTEKNTWTISDQIQSRKRCLRNCQKSMNDLTNSDTRQSTLESWMNFHLETIQTLIDLKREFNTQKS